MITWITANLGTLAIGLLVLGVVTAIVVKLTRDKKKGKHLGCDCGTCGESCPFGENCAGSDS
ncbi:MAG: FeoB-associated Cys-rich membrane protein [Oscillospiraceae bacterium]|jgi:hypothetical protein|nr:FeoB-associated Cys-rich membrane protein [Oscillospiraceae bacterium]